MLISYKNDPKLKEMLLKEVEKHRKADQIIQRTYGEENGQWRGCAVACTLRSLAILNGEKLITQYDNHLIYEKELGIPKWLALLEDKIFEGLSVQESKEWPEQFLKAIPVGKNLEQIKSKFFVFILQENIDRVSTLKISDKLKKQVVDVLQKVLELHQKKIKTGIWDKGAARSAVSAAWNVAKSAAWSVESAAWSVESAAWNVARSAARSAESAAWSAAWSVAWSAEWSAKSAAWSAVSAAWNVAKSAAWSTENVAWTRYAKKLLEFIKEA